MPTLTVDLNLPDDLYERAKAVPPADQSHPLTATARIALGESARFAVASNRPCPAMRKIDFAAEAKAAFEAHTAMREAMDAIPDDANAIDFESMKANLNANRHLTGEEPLF